MFSSLKSVYLPDPELNCADPVVTSNAFDNASFPDAAEVVTLNERDNAFVVLLSINALISDELITIKVSPSLKTLKPSLDISSTVLSLASFTSNNACAFKVKITSKVINNIFFMMDSFLFLFFQQFLYTF